MDWKFLLLFRWAVWQIFGLGLLAFAWQNGLVQKYAMSDPLSMFGGGILLLGVFVSGRAALSISSALNKAKSSPFSINALRVKLSTASALNEVSYYRNAAMLLGLIGTLYGFSIVLDVLPAIQGGGDAGGLSAGAKVAIYPTLVGALVAVWLGHMRLMLGKARTKLLIAIGEE